MRRRLGRIPAPACPADRRCFPRLTASKGLSSAMSVRVTKTLLCHTILHRETLIPPSPGVRRESDPSRAQQCIRYKQQGRQSPTRMEGLRAAPEASGASRLASAKAIVWARSTRAAARFPVPACRMPMPRQAPATAWMCACATASQSTDCLLRLVCLASSFSRGPCRSAAHCCRALNASIDV